MQNNALLALKCVKIVEMPKIGVVRIEMTVMQLSSANDAVKESMTEK